MFFVLPIFFSNINSCTHFGWSIYDYPHPLFHLQYWLIFLVRFYGFFFLCSILVFCPWWLPLGTHLLPSVCLQCNKTKWNERHLGNLLQTATWLSDEKTLASKDFFANVLLQLNFQLIAQQTKFKFMQPRLKVPRCFGFILSFLKFGSNAETRVPI